MARLRNVRGLILCVSVFYYFVETQANYGNSNRGPFKSGRKSRMNNDWQNNHYGRGSNPDYYYNTRSDHLYNEHLDNDNSCNQQTQGQGHKEHGPRRPHIVFIIADDLGWNEVSWNNEEFRDVTPTLGKLAEEGVILDSYYTQPSCVPSRASILLGLYTFKTGFPSSHLGINDSAGIDPGFYTLPERLRNLGYGTNLIGKWGLGSCTELFSPLNNGFNSFYGAQRGYDDYFTKINSQGLFDLRDNTGFSQDNTTYVEILFRQRAIEIIQNLPKDQLLYLQYATYMPHNPLQVPPEYKNRFPFIEDYNTRILAAMMSILDDSVRDIVGALKAQGIWEDTLLVFISDNGGSARGGSASNEPLRDGKGSLYEGGIRVPAFIHSNLIKRRGRRSKSLIYAADWLNTFLSVSRGIVDKTLDSLNMWDMISEGTPSPRTEIVHNIDRIAPIRSIRSGNYKLIATNPDALLFFKAVTITSHNSDISLEEILETFNITSESPENITELYNLEDDPFETKNLALQEPHIVIRLLKRLVEHEKDLVPSFDEIPSKFCV